MKMRLIDADELFTTPMPNARGNGKPLLSLWAYVVDQITHAPTIDPESLRPKGRWAAINADCRGYANAFECSNCETISHTHTYMKECEFEYCPVCGAKMEG